MTPPVWPWLVAQITCSDQHRRGNVNQTSQGAGGLGGKEFFNQLQIICFNLVLNRYFISICLNHDSCQINCQLGYETVNNLGLLTHNNISSVCVRRSSIFSMIVFLADPTLLFVETPCFTAAQFICLIQSQTKCSTLLYPSLCWNGGDIGELELI